MKAVFCLFLTAILSSAILGHPTSSSVTKEHESEPRQPSHPDITQVVTARPGYSAEYNVRRDPPPSEDDLQRYRRRRNAPAGEESEAYDEYEEDDSDMFMEPMELEKTETKAPASVKATEEESVPKVESSTATSDSHQTAQHFFPSFAPIFSLGHSRSRQLFHQEPFYTGNARVSTAFGFDYNSFIPMGSFGPPSSFRPYRESSYKFPLSFDDEAISTNILGSGNFGVLKGGTYYNKEDDYRGVFGSPFSNNGHGRPYFSNPRPQKYSGADFFSNFRDFAEINTPTKTSFSEYVVVYVNKNSTNPDVAEENRIDSRTKSESANPRNIFEQLKLLDETDEDSDGSDGTEGEENPDQKKVSLQKRKLAQLKRERLNKEQKKPYYKDGDSGKDFLEPLLALS